MAIHRKQVFIELKVLPWSVISVAMCTWPEFEHKSLSTACTQGQRSPLAATAVVTSGSLSGRAARYLFCVLKMVFARFLHHKVTVSPL